MENQQENFQITFEELTMAIGQKEVDNMVLRRELAKKNELLKALENKSTTVDKKKS